MRVVESDFGIQYRISLNIENLKLKVEYRNIKNKEMGIAGYIIRIDERRIFGSNLNLSAGERGVKEINITPGLNVNQDEHTVTFSTYGNHTQFNFTRQIDSSEPGPIPTPYIADVEVTEGTIKGETSAVANVTIVNPSDQLYSTKLMVHTIGTDGSLYPASVRPGDSRTITVELLDDPANDIAGEARLYTGNMTTEEGAMDQVEFAGRADAETQAWNTSYEPAKPTWMDDNYEYENRSYNRRLDEKLSAGQKIGGIPIVYPIGAAVLVVLALRKLC